jgi:hypothetical protein
MYVACTESIACLCPPFHTSLDWHCDGIMEAVCLDIKSLNTSGNIKQVYVTTQNAWRKHEAHRMAESHRATLRLVTSLQAHARAYLVRAELVEQHIAASRIQAVCRGWLARTHYQRQVCKCDFLTWPRTPYAAVFYSLTTFWR